MVTKPYLFLIFLMIRSVLAKIFMVTKLLVHASDIQVCSVLAKIHMVTKPSLK